MPGRQKTHGGIAGAGISLSFSKFDQSDSSGPIERGLVAGERVGCAEEVSATANVLDGLDREVASLKRDRLKHFGPSWRSSFRGRRRSSRARPTIRLPASRRHGFD